MGGGEVAAAAFGIGLCTGMRCFTPICVLALMQVPATGLFGMALGWPYHSVVFGAAAVGELVWDKLPKTPSRLEGPGMIGRILFGGFCATALASTSGAGVMPGFAALVGVAGAVLGALGGHRFRVAAGERGGWLAAVVEDVVCIAGSVGIARLFV